MGCVSVPTIPLPTLPAPLSISPPIPTVPDLGIPNLCCKLPVQIPDIPAIPIPALVLNPTVIQTLQTYVRQVTTYIDAIPFRCPAE